jgi:regulator of cell morphogenesis and NO signaling
MIHPDLATTTLTEIVQRDFRAGAILDSYRLDYCCGGAATLAEACRLRGIDVESVIAKLEALHSSSGRFVGDDPAALIQHIVSRHHAYVRRSMSQIEDHLEKVVEAHGARHAELPFIESEFAKVASELQQHLVKEEQVLFPYIASLNEAVRSGGPHPPDMFGTVQNPIRMMEIEHQEATDRLSAIRHLSHDYTPPADACQTYRVVLDELQAFEEDLRVHVDLEDNVLFPMAVELEEKAEMMGHGLKSDQWQPYASGR